VALKTISLGAALIVLGVIVTIASSSGSATSLIPAFVGIVFVVLGLVARAKPDLNHHLMHGSAALALIAVLGSLGSAIGRGAEGWALFAQVGTIVLCAAYLVLAVQSFRQARLARESA
jgi:CO dehydrogenase/acetyl-CoA synthase epsilon subunit